MRHRVAIMAILALLIIMMAPHARGSTPQSELSVTLDNGVTSVSINLHIRQNITSMIGTFALPQVHSLVEGSNATGLAREFEEAIQSKSPSAQVRNLRLLASSTQWSNATGLQWFNITMSFSVDGVARHTAGVPQVDMSWKSFAVTGDMTINGAEVNNIGIRYLASPAGQLANIKGSSFVTVSFIVNSKPVSSFGFSSAVATIRTFNFSTLAPKVSEWTHKPSQLLSQTSWTLSSKVSLGMLFTRTIAEPGIEQERTAYGLFYDLNGAVLAPHGSSSTADAVVVASSSLPEVLMGITILSTALVGSGAFFYERRLSGVKWKKKPKR